MSDLPPYMSPKQIAKACGVDVSSEKRLKQFRRKLWRAGLREPLEGRTHERIDTSKLAAIRPKLFDCVAEWWASKCGNESASAYLDTLPEKGNK